jgi:hypothetical protein
MEFVFTITGDFKTEFVKYVDMLFERASTLTRKQRTKLSGTLIEAYVATTGQRPNGKQLERLGSLILHEELTLNDPHKASKIDIYSDRQFERREKEMEADFRLAEQYGTDGVKHGAGRRNHKTNMID